MKLNRKWLHEEFVDLSHVSDKEFVEKLTIFGQKVETYERMDAEIKNVVVGKIVKIDPHTNSDHMVICQIDTGIAFAVTLCMIQNLPGMLFQTISGGPLSKLLLGPSGEF